VGARQKVREALIQVYEKRLARALEGADVPQHVGVIMDGNRRWARAIGLEDVAHGHRRGADKIVDLLGWCDDAGVSVVTLFMLSTDNLRRQESEVEALLKIIEDVAVDLSRPGRPWQVRSMGAPEVLPPETVAVLKQAEEDTRDRPGATVNLAAGRRSPTPSARCWPSTPNAVPPWRTSCRRWRSSTSPSTSTRAASPTPTW
jgi:short-chain Z-isoprenyl diphosphate synthase